MRPILYNAAGSPVETIINQTLLSYYSRTAPILALSSGALACERLRFEGRGRK